jgi:hypothetical protein
VESTLKYLTNTQDGAMTAPLRSAASDAENHSAKLVLEACALHVERMYGWKETSIELKNMNEKVAALLKLSDESNRAANVVAKIVEGQSTLEISAQLIRSARAQQSVT